MSPPTSGAPSDAPSSTDPIPVDAAPGNGSTTAVKARTKKDEYKWGPPDNTPTGIGAFSAVYRPSRGTMTVTVSCKFTFNPGGRTVFVPDPETGGTKAETKYDTPWPAGEPDKWKAKFLAQASEFWSYRFAFVCTAPKLEWLRAFVLTKFVEVTSDGQDVVKVSVYYGDSPDLKVSCGDEDRSCMGGSAATFHRDIVDDMAARHEAGHMIGLGDEYPERGKSPEAKHSKLVEQEFGHKVIRGQCDPESIMNNSHKGTKVLREHCVVFLDVLRQATKEENLTWIPLPEVTLVPDPP